MFIRQMLQLAGALALAIVPTLFASAFAANVEALSVVQVGERLHDGRPSIAVTVSNTLVCHLRRRALVLDGVTARTRARLWTSRSGHWPCIRGCPWTFSSAAARPPSTTAVTTAACQ
jgi:hypothetical protein